jgi:hypothetical protein
MRFKNDNAVLQQMGCGVTEPQKLMDKRMGFSIGSSDALPAVSTITIRPIGNRCAPINLSGGILLSWLGYDRTAEHHVKTQDVLERTFTYSTLTQAMLPDISGKA